MVRIFFNFNFRFKDISETLEVLLKQSTNNLCQKLYVKITFL